MERRTRRSVSLLQHAVAKRISTGNNSRRSVWHRSWSDLGKLEERAVRQVEQVYTVLSTKFLARSEAKILKREVLGRVRKSKPESVTVLSLSYLASYPDLPFLALHIYQKNRSLNETLKGTLSGLSCLIQQLMFLT